MVLAKEWRMVSVPLASTLGRAVSTIASPPELRKHGMNLGVLLHTFYLMKLKGFIPVPVTLSSAFYEL